MLVTRRFALQLLAPTVLVSLILVGACVFGTIYLNNLHLNASAVLTENRRRPGGGVPARDDDARAFAPASRRPYQRTASR